MSLLLTLIGCHVNSAKNGEEALDCIRAAPPDIVFLDMRLPGMSGLDTAVTIAREWEARIKLVAMSASALDHERERYLKAGCDDFVAKPFRAERIYRCLRNLLDAQYIFKEKSKNSAEPELSIDLGQLALCEDLAQRLTTAAEFIGLLNDALERKGHEIFAASDGDSGFRIACMAKPALILLDVMMPLLDGMATCQKLKTTDLTRDIPVIFITARQDTESVLSGFRSGAVDYIHKPFHMEEVLIRVETHLQIGRLTRELRARNEELETEIGRRREAEEARRTADERYLRLSADEAARWGIAGFVGESRTVRKIVEEVKRVYRFANTSVLIQGESGTGKELVSRAIHHGSSRSAAPFIPVNCVAIPADLANPIPFPGMCAS